VSHLKSESGRTRVVACIPALNEEKTIAKVIIRAKRYVDRVVVVDDGSTDDTILIAEGLGAKVIRHGRNLGYGAALRSCFEAGRDMGADVLVTLDADGQHDPDQIPKVAEPIKREIADLVVGSRFLGENNRAEAPAHRRLGIKVLTELTGAASKVPISDAQSGFRAYSRNAIEKILPAEQGMGASVEILIKASQSQLRIVEVPITVKYDDLVTSTHNPVYQGMDVLASIIKLVSIRHPLQFYGGIGLVASAVSVAFGIWTLDLFAREGRVVTNIALVAIGAGLLATLSFFTAAILFTLINVIREKT
jgi:glycosyltransferase involved in cell wall biosynthesis